MNMKETVDSVTKFTVAWPLVSNISVDLTPTLFLEKLFNLSCTIILLHQSNKIITSNIEDIFFIFSLIFH